MTSDRDASLPELRRIEAQILFFDVEGRVLLVESPRREWRVPGGAIEPEEAPWAACDREIQEQLGLTRRPQRLLAVEWLSAASDTPEALVMVFDGGVLVAGDIANIWLPIVRLRSYAFCTLEEASQRLTAPVSHRLAECVRVRESGAVAVLEDGQRVF